MRVNVSEKFFEKAREFIMDQEELLHGRSEDGEEAEGESIGQMYSSAYCPNLDAAEWLARANRLLKSILDRTPKPKKKQIHKITLRKRKQKGGERK